MKKSPFYQFLLPAMLIMLLSCADKQDFSQYDDLAITPTTEAALLYVETPESIINMSPTATYYSQDFNFDAFEEAFVADNVLDGIITYELENTTSKELEITVDFLDGGGNVLDSEIFLIEPGPTSVLRREIAYGGTSGKNIDILRNTSGIRVSGRNLGDTTSVSAVQDPKVIFRSAAQVRIRLK